MVPNLHKEIFLPILSTSIAVIMIVQIGTKMNGFESHYLYQSDYIFYSVVRRREIRQARKRIMIVQILSVLFSEINVIQSRSEILFTKL